MSFLELVDKLIRDTTTRSLPAYLPELVLCGTIVLMLLLRVPSWGRKVNVFWVALLGVALALVVTAPQYFLSNPTLEAANRPDLVPAGAVTHLGEEIFTGLLIYDKLTVFFRGMLIFFTFLFVVLTRLSGIPDQEEAPDFYTLVLGSVVGMCIMVSANHLLMVFLGVEMASVPAYVLAGTLKGRRQASEAALKFAVYGAGAAGVMLYGISLLAGALGTVHIPTMSYRMAELLLAGGEEKQVVLILGGLMLMVGLAFKLSAVPFHFWAPDVFEGATAEINAFLSVASKAAALGLLVRVAIGFGGESLSRAVPSHPRPQPAAASAPVLAAEQVRLVAAERQEGERGRGGEGETRETKSPAETKTPAVTPATKHGETEGAHAPAQAMQNEKPASKPSARTMLMALQPARSFMVLLIGMLAAVTATFGNLAAYGQTNIKRLLAYSTIAHAGYMMMPVAAAVELMGEPANRVSAQNAVASLAVYLATYLFMNLGAFAIVAFMRNVMNSEKIADYAGLIHRCPGVVICFSIILLSLVGIPPLAGFVAKFAIFATLVDAHLGWLLVIGGLNTVVSLIYYLRVVKVMIMDPEPSYRPPVRFSLFTIEAWYVMAITIPVAVLIVWWNPLQLWTQAAASNLF